MSNLRKQHSPITTSKIPYCLPHFKPQRKQIFVPKTTNFFPIPQAPTTHTRFAEFKFYLINHHTTEIDPVKTAITLYTYNTTTVRNPAVTLTPRSNVVVTLHNSSTVPKNNTYNAKTNSSSRSTANTFDK